MKFRNFEKYEVFEDGRIWSYKTKRFLKPILDKDGYQLVHLSDNECKIKNYYVHRVVYEAFTGSPIPQNMQINHRSEVKTENFFENMELVTPKQNINWGTRNKRMAKSNTNNPKRSKAVGAFKDGELIMTFPSSGEAQRQGFKKSAVSACCNGKLPHYKGYTWKYI